MQQFPFFKPSLIKAGMRVLVRLDLNVPIQNGKVTDTFRIEQALATLKILVAKKAKVVVLSHLGDKNASLGPIADILKKKIKSVSFAPYLIGDRANHAVESMKDGDVLILENLRSHEGEEGNAPSFARALSRFGDIFIQDGFAVAHRKHASVVGIPTFIPSYLGPEFEKELHGLEKALNPTSPCVVIIGGAKFSTKLPLIKQYVKTNTTLFIGGALAHSVLKARGVDVGMSLLDTTIPVPTTVTKAMSVLVPLDGITDSGKIVDIRHVGMRDKIMDVGVASVALITEHIAKAKTVIMNGPLGLYEEGYTQGTAAVLKALAKVKGTTIIGGGDTVALARKLKLDKKIDFVSTGGGAMLDYLTYGTLPALDAIKKGASQKK